MSHIYSSTASDGNDTRLAPPGQRRTTYQRYGQLSLASAYYMPDLSAQLTGLVVGDDYDVERAVTGIPTGATLTAGWLTIKRRESDLDAAAILQKQISTSGVSGVGQITDDGATDLVGTVLFQLTNTETATLNSRITYWYDIQVKTSTGKIYTVEKGRFTPKGQITRATS